MALLARALAGTSALMHIFGYQKCIHNHHNDILWPAYTGISLQHMWFIALCCIYLEYVEFICMFYFTYICIYSAYFCIYCCIVYLHTKAYFCKFFCHLFMYSANILQIWCICLLMWCICLHTIHTFSYFCVQYARVCICLHILCIQAHSQAHSVYIIFWHTVRILYAYLLHVCCMYMVFVCILSAYIWI